jgi:hypothetical protein
MKFVIGLIAVALLFCFAVEANAFPRPLKRLKQAVCHRHNGQQTSNGQAACAACQK